MRDGKAVAHGQIPTWLPNQFAGVPFASDPQSGWLYLPVLLLFGSMSCTRALGLFITLNPILAGLGMYWFFRNERRRPPGRDGRRSGDGDVDRRLGRDPVDAVRRDARMDGDDARRRVGLPARATRRSAAGWLAFAGFAWGQIAAAHLTDGLLIGSVVVGLYALARLVDAGAREASERSARRRVAAVVARWRCRCCRRRSCFRVSRCCREPRSDRDTCNSDG